MILSYGGCGGLFTPSIGEAIGSRGVLIPGLASVLSAFGAATTDVRRERIKAVLEPMPVDPMLLEKLGQELQSQVNADLEADGIEPSARVDRFRSRPPLQAAGMGDLHPAGHDSNSNGWSSVRWWTASRTSTPSATDGAPSSSARRSSSSTSGRSVPAAR